MTAGVAAEEAVSAAEVGAVRASAEAFHGMSATKEVEAGSVWLAGVSADEGCSLSEAAIAL
jgi:hypothetical protein